MVKDYPIVFCRFYLISAESEKFFKKLGEFMRFDIYLGFNGKVWISAETVAHTIFIFNSLDRVSSLIIENLEQGDQSGFDSQNVKDEIDKIMKEFQKKVKSKSKKAQF
uniref:K Homology domain-containing protein n=1 Tax=Strombidium rassoulzadegani TaxID=1082188 RepID=A0A7S3CMJ2_9SPIT|mmetsp:Transcript_17453/g.29372  ORF Transcript_17453/g.29372 Transcript_17453/m.29372 type:complete len:108 (+) Transcript_17453:536-859(+)